MAMCPKTNQPAQDIVYTPRSLAKQIIDHYAPTGKLLDPCRGDGAFYDQYPSNCEKDYCEIQEGKDFYAYKDKVDWIITNPPWSILRKFTQHAMNIKCDNIVFLFNFNALMTKARLRDITDSGYGVSEIYCVDTPDSKETGWPQAGFQLGAVNIKRDYKGSINLNGSLGGSQYL